MPEPASVNPDQVNVAVSSVALAVAVPFTGGAVSSTIEAEAGLAVTLPLASFHQARTVFTPSPFDSVKLFDAAAVTPAEQVVASQRQTCAAVPEVTDSVAGVVGGVVAGGGVEDTPVSDASRSRRGVVMPLRAAFTGAPYFVRRDTRSDGDSLGNAAASTAMAPATCGVACDVPDMVMPAAVIITPGARMVRNDAEHEKQATLSGAVVAALQLDQPMPPRLAACTAPTDTASGNSGTLNALSSPACGPD